MGRMKDTRAGSYGSIDTDKLKEANYGFGVFAYSTGTTAYSSYRTQNVDDTHQFPNFMYNEKITWSSTKWTYENTKYWPNEVKNGAADDQMNDTNNDPATTDYTHGGNVSFFAYAPYATPANLVSDPGIVGQGVSTSDNDGTNSGIVAISTNNFNGGKDNASADNEKYKYSDPYLKYVLSTSNDKQVDLLWGTTGINSVNVLGTAQPGIAANTYADKKTDGSDYDAADRPTFNVNSDLTKQKTLGTVDFNFKHALAKIGGSYVGTGDGSDEDGTTPTNGLMVILDIDKDGQELGGSLQAYTGTKVADASAFGELDGADVRRTTYSTFAEYNANTKYNTKVTINQIILESGKQLNATGEGKLGSATAIESSDFDWLTDTGIFNLVTGVWSNKSTTNNSTMRTQTVWPSGADIGGSTTEDAKKDAVLATEIAQPTNWTNGHTQAAFEALPIGVTTVAKNVYESDAQPFVFIPGTKPVVKVTIDYTVRTFDSKLSWKYTDVRQKITKNLYITEAVQLNKQYNILMHLGLTSVKFTATVSDWEATNATGTTTDPGSGESPVTIFEDEVEHVYLPINVSSLALTYSAGPVTYFASNSDGGSVGTITKGTYWVGAQSTDVNASNLSAVHEDGSAADSWVTYTSGTGALAFTGANTTFTDKNEVVYIKATASPATYLSEPISVTQYGRIAKAITYTTSAAITGLANTASASIDMAPTSIQASGFESDANGKATSTVVAATDISSESYDLVFIDDNTHAVADWITVTNKNIVVGLNSTGASRSATLWVRLNGKLVPVTSDGTAKIQVTQNA